MVNEDKQEPSALEKAKHRLKLRYRSCTQLYRSLNDIESQEISDHNKKE